MTPLPRLLRFYVLAAVFLAASCSSTESITWPDSGAPKDSLAADGRGDLEAGTVIAPSDTVETVDQWILPDLDVQGYDVEFVPEEGWFLWPCTEADDCISSYCLETEAWGQVCTINCETECPLNWKCKSKAVGSDIIYLCSPPETDLCTACEEDDDCGSPVDLCLPIGNDGGRFCGTRCDSDTDCPEDYVCSELTLADDALVKQCVPDTGSCVCFGDLDGTLEACFQENEHGKCFGERICDGPDGWSECSATVPGDEVCDGVDNDCDGEKDNGLVPESCEVTNEHGTCTATAQCHGGDGWVCSAATPGPDQCDGLDNDCDGETDEDFPLLGEACDNPDDEDECAEGTWQCNDQGMLSCVDDPPHYEVCNGKDDDCDGIADDPWPEKDEPCDGPDEDKCANGVWVCDGDDKLACIGDVNQTEICDGLDNDCNTVTDDGFPDYDHDNIADCVDEDDDGDGVPETDGGDNCPKTPNPDQLDNDEDGVGDACDDDDDNDGVKDPVDNCKFDSNATQKDTDNDGDGDACDDDDDGDGINDDEDNCPLSFNPLQPDNDDDGVGDECDDDDDNDGVPDLQDCKPFDPTIYPGALEVCNGKDDNCDGLTDPENAQGCEDFYIDADNDGYGFGGLKKCVCGDDGQPPYTALSTGDCNDSNPAINPLAEELCNNIDDNCDDDVDNFGATGCELRYRDHDGDTYGVYADKKCVCGQKGEYTATKSGDCNDNDVKVYPGANEYCNGKDDNCNYQTDEEGSLGCNTWYLDEDGDGWGIEGFTKCLCAASGIYNAQSAGDCNDSDADIAPGKEESCDGKDNNCNGSLDEENAVGCKDWFLDLDKDGFGNSAEFRCLCTAKDFYTAAKGGDCDDANPNISVGKPESCNGWDDDCDGIIDEDTLDCVVYYFDDDADGYGDPLNSQCLCQPGQGYNTLVGGDCDDNSPAVNPGADEVCNLLDDDCNGVADDDGAAGCVTFYMDGDKDGAGNSFKSKCLCAPAGDYTAPEGGDCNDAEPKANPGMSEVCDGIDNNCDNKTDEMGADGCILFYMDADGDGFGITSASQCTCEPVGVYSATMGGDCNDNNGAVNPGVDELCDGADNNCINGIDEGFPDNDGDGVKDCLDDDKDGDGDPIGSDCDDNDPMVNKFAQEKCDGIDNNCNGKVDEENAVGCQTWYYDGDQDGYGMSTQFKCLCQKTGLHNTTQPQDCDDTKAFIYPGAVEQCNGIDDNCNGSIDEGNPVAMCGSVLNGYPTCTNGKCSIGSCEPHYYDLDNFYDSGCECTEDMAEWQGQGNKCASAMDLGTLQPGGIPQTPGGNLVPGNDEDWYSFTAVDAPDSGCNDYTVRVTFDMGGDAFRFQVYKDGCDPVDNLLCTDGDDFEWTVDFYDGAEGGGECPCSYEVGPPATGHYAEPGKNFCQTHGGKYYIRVYRKQGVPANCDGYKLKVENGG